jgi:hypothetical protein
MTVTSSGYQAGPSLFLVGSLRQAARFDPAKLATESLGRSHRAKIGKTRCLLHRPDARNSPAA